MNFTRDSKAKTWPCLSKCSTSSVGRLPRLPTSVLTIARSWGLCRDCVKSAGYRNLSVSCVKVTWSSPLVDRHGATGVVLIRVYPPRSIESEGQLPVERCILFPLVHVSLKALEVSTENIRAEDAGREAARGGATLAIFRVVAVYELQKILSCEVQRHGRTVGAPAESRSSVERSSDAIRDWRKRMEASKPTSSVSGWISI